MINNKAAEELSKKKCGHWCALFTETNLLNQQRCIYCSGYGHSGKDCPTDAKLRNLRGGVAAQNKALAQVRREVRGKFKMNTVREFSLLSPYKRPARLLGRGPGAKKAKKESGEEDV